MGHGSYSTVASIDDYTGKTMFSRSDTDKTRMYASSSIKDTFKQNNINNAMNPYGVGIRESRDSEDHPNSIPIIIGLDVTGSMGFVPHELVKNGLPNIMGSIIQKGIPDPQVLFLGIGDHECDRSPLQVSQFESNDELLDKWLTEVYLEGGGGGNSGESYMLAWYFAAYHTQLDSLDNRQKKGYLFTIGDEPVLRHLPESSIKKIMGPGQYQNFTSAELFEKAREKYHVYHIHVAQTMSGGRQNVVNGWRELVQDNLMIAPRGEDIANIISDKVIEQELLAVPTGEPTYVAMPDLLKPAAVPENKREEVIL